MTTNCYACKMSIDEDLIAVEFADHTVYICHDCVADAVGEMLTELEMASAAYCRPCCHSTLGGCDANLTPDTCC